jgi:hypothetical protein
VTNFKDLVPMVDDTAASIDAATDAAIRAEIAVSDAYDRWEVLLDLHAGAAYDKYAAEVALAAWKSDAKRVGDMRRLSYYDETDYIVPSNGLSAERFRSALYDAWATSLTGSAVGGYSTPRVADNGDGTLTVTSVYHLGD